MIRIKRVYDPPARDDGLRYLVDRLWPRGLSKAEAGIDGWLREIAPSNELRNWFGHDPSRWEEFRMRYRQELERRGELLNRLASEGCEGNVTLLYAAKDRERNNAVVLKELLERNP